jgi:uncharacterized paraquat-inducible protein A
VSIYGRIDGTDPVRPDPVGRGGAAQEERRRARSTLVAEGTLACPACDAPVALLAGAVSPAQSLFCPVCEHSGRVRDFLSLARPTRPARVDVRLVVSKT